MSQSKRLIGRIKLHVQQLLAIQFQHRTASQQLLWEAWRKASLGIKRMICSVLQAGSR